jgi:hypothetical protein
MLNLNLDNCQDVEGFKGVKEFTKYMEVATEKKYNKIGKKPMGKKYNDEPFVNLKNIELLTESDGTENNEDLIDEIGAPVSENNKKPNLDGNQGNIKSVVDNAPSTSELTGSDLDNYTEPIVDESEMVGAGGEYHKETFIEKNKFYIILALIFLVLSGLSARD